MVKVMDEQETDKVDIPTEHNIWTGMDVKQAAREAVLL